MSIVFAATSIAIALAVSGIPATMAMGLCLKREEKMGELEEQDALQTYFADSNILKKTLLEYGFQVTEDEEAFVVTTDAGSIRFFKKEADGAFFALPFDLKSPEELGKYADEIEEEYMRNVQKNNYLTLKKRLKERSDMKLESETVLEDGTILLTIQV